MPPLERSTVESGYSRAREGDRGGEGARTRILEAAYELFSRHGIHAVGIDRIIAEAPVAKATLYHHFASKEDLVCAFLEMRQRRWTVEWLQTEVEARASTGKRRVLAVFEALDEWFNRPDFEGCAFITTLLQSSDAAGPIHQATVRHLEVIRSLLERYAEEAHLARPADVACQLQILMMGAIVSAGRGDIAAARRTRLLAELLLDGAT
jgi:AcrR family transcriptional regulator